MDLERAMILQRDALLRLLAGLVIAVRVMSFGPLANLVPRWVAAFISSFLDRAEAAAQCLVIATAAKSGVRVSCSSKEFARLLANAERVEDAGLDPSDLISSDRLWTRIEALRDVLENLPRHARRLVRCLTQRAEPSRLGLASDTRNTCVSEVIGVHFGYQRFVPKIERPPDKDWRLSLRLSPSLRFRSGRRRCSRALRDFCYAKIHLPQENCAH